MTMEEEVLEQEKECVVDVKDVSMSFDVPEFKYDTMKERVVNFLRGRRNRKKKIKVLDGVSFKIYRGESLGVIGHNGAGKSTLLKIVSGIYAPKTGSVKTKGQVVLLNLGAGFDMEADAIENIYLNGAILGYSRKQMRERFDSIVEFSELKDFLKLPLKNYSSGMISRLGFAIAIDVHPDVLLVDEVLSVGDANFQRKCLERIKTMQREGTSLLFVSHSISQVRSFCKNTIWIENSRVMAYGDSETVCKKYLDYCEHLGNVGK